MKKIRQNSKKGFTLVELIVVLVILAVMAAMLVPALTGYIDEARKKKDYNAASEVLTAAQAVVAEYYANPGTQVDANGNPTAAYAATYVDGQDTRIATLSGIDGVQVSGTAVNTTSFEITGITVTFTNGNSYTYASGQWT